MAGREKGGNAIDPPLEAYSTVLFQAAYPAGVTAAEIPEDLERGRQLLYDQLVHSSLSLNIC